MSRTNFHIFTCLSALCFANAASAGTVQFQLGEQDFADGKTPIFSREIRAAGEGEAYPFDGTIFGHDVKSSLGSFDFVHTFDLGGVQPLAAKLTIGLIDIDSPPEAPFDTIALSFNGVSQPSELLMGISAAGRKSSVEVVDIPVPVELLADGSLHVSFAAKRPGYGNIGNAIEADFSRLVVEMASSAVIPVPLPPIVDPPAPQPVPLPPVLLPAGALMLALAALPKRRLRQWLRL